MKFIYKVPTAKMGAYSFAGKKTCEGCSWVLKGVWVPDGMNTACIISNKRSICQNKLRLFKKIIRFMSDLTVILLTDLALLMCSYLQIFSWLHCTTV